ncbi:uncharacterized protein LOC122276807 [Carya illinoinensis]|uniref:uncharacterized protein LOC122276807 n=1 Tax=Carya illinoinensis TaxID=32201 RepID=UPI001C71C225|nr:uncharacterized protein LOC122276807 [Carya illinoinensis]
MDNDSWWNDEINIEENEASDEGSSSNVSNTFDENRWAEWNAWRSCNDGTQEEAYIFWALCNRLRRDVALHDSTQEVTVEEALEMFCYIVGHGVVQRNSANLFQHLVETVNRHVYVALCCLARHVIKPIQTTGMMPYIEGNPKYYPWFEKCHGAMDEVMINAAMPSSVTNAYLNRYQRLAQNVLCVCDFNMKFAFVYSEWEGTAHYARFLIDALRHLENNFS